MRNPLRVLKDIVSENADRVRGAAKEAAKEAANRLDIINGRDRHEPVEPQPHREPDRPASVAFGHHDEESVVSKPDDSDQSDQQEEQSAASAETTQPAEETESEQPPSKESRTDEEATADESPPGADGDMSGEPGEWTSADTDESSSEGDEEAGESGEAIGVLFDRHPGSIRTLQPIDKDGGGQGRHKQTRHVFVTTGEWAGDADGEASPDVTLDVSKLKLDALELEVDDLDAQVALQASIAELVDVNVGASVQLGEVELVIKGVEAEALLEVSLSEVRNILGRALKTIEEHPEIITEALDAAESATDDIEDTAESATEQAGEVGKEAAGELGNTTESATDAAGNIAEAAAEDAPDPSIRAESRAEYEPEGSGS